MTAGVVGRIRAARSDQLLVNSALTLATTVLMAAGGAIFWVIAARLASPQDVGLAGSLVATADSLALFAQLGLNVTLMKTMPSSDRKGADVLSASLVVFGAGVCFALVYSLVLPIASPALASVLHNPLTIALYCLLVGAAAINVLTDSVFLSINRVWSYLKLNGLLLGAAKIVLPFFLAGAGAFGLYGSVGLAIALCAVASLWVLMSHLPWPRTLRPSKQLLSARRFAGAGYVTYVLFVAPLLVYPILVINALGASAGAAYFVSFQVVTLQNAVILALANAAYAESERAVTGRHAVVRKGGLTLMVASVGASAAMFVLAPLFLEIFGGHYVAEGTTTLRVLSLATVAAAFNYWSAIRLRLSGNLRAMILVQLMSTSVMLGLAGVLAPMGTAWVGFAWGVGHLVGGVVGFVVTRTVAPFSDESPAKPLEPAAAEA